LYRRKWENIELVGDSPSERTDHSLVIYSGKLYIFGGFDGKTRYNDLYKCNMQSKKFIWKKIDSEGAIPMSRFGHSAVVHEHSMFIFGGWNGHDTMDDMY
jgi:N-acetylneuraminic acid mutarotase